MEFPLWFSRLRTWHCCSCSSGLGIGHSCGPDSIPGPATSMCHGCGQENRKEKKKNFFTKHIWETLGQNSHIHTAAPARLLRAFMPLCAVLLLRPGVCNVFKQPAEEVSSPMRPLVRLRQQSKAQVPESGGPGFKCRLCEAR